ncbi:MAG: methylated-DNA--[protein]-cysteine S-methyltransferase [Bacteriovoracaceae bacterium]
MKEQFAILPELPIVGTLRVKSLDGKTIASIEVVKRQAPTLLNPFFKKCFTEFELFLKGKKKNIDIQLDHSSLTPFQARVLKEMKKIPYGEIQTYKDLALRMKTKGYQAIGSACGKNPFLLIYPCHRVVGSKDLGGFAHGLKMKKELLLLEKSLSRISNK